MPKVTLPTILAVVVTLGFFAIIFILVYHAEPNSNERLLDILFGVLAAKFASIIDYHFGSSSGSAVKTAILAQQTQTPPSTVNK